MTQSFAIGRTARSTLLVSHLDATVVEETYEAVPVVEAIADRRRDVLFSETVASLVSSRAQKPTSRGRRRISF
jgi:hypothetical protein